MNVGLDVLPLPVWFGLTLVVVLAALKIGERIGAWRRKRIVAAGLERTNGPETGSVLGLLAFMLAFTFGMATSRYDARRQLVLEEANAIGTADLRARLVSNPEGGEIRALLREYVDVRLRAASDMSTLASGIIRSEEIHRELWRRLEVLVKRESVPIHTLLAQSINDVIDLHTTRLTAVLHSRVPITVWGGLYIVTLLAMTLIGYEAGLAGTKRMLAPMFLILAFSVVILLIADLDRPQEGLLKVGQGALMDLQKSMLLEGGR